MGNVNRTHQKAASRTLNIMEEEVKTSQTVEKFWNLEEMAPLKSY